MRKYSQGDIIRIEGYKNLFLIVSRNKLIEATQCFHVCPILEEISEGQLLHRRRIWDGSFFCFRSKMRKRTVPYFIY